MWLGELQSRSGRVRKISLLPGFDPRSVQPETSRHTDYATLAPRTHGKCLGTTSLGGMLAGERVHNSSQQVGEHSPTWRCSSHFSVEINEPFKAYWLRDATTGLKFNNCTLPPHNAAWRDFLLGTLLLESCISLIYAWKTNKYTNYSLSLLIMYGSSYMFRHYIAIFRERS
jgi:hypothetical protein